MPEYALYDGGELYVVATYFFEEVVEFQRIIGIVVVHYRHAIPFHTMLFQQIDALHYFYERRLTLLILAIFVVKFLWPVDRDTYQPVVFTEEFAPFIRQHGSVGLYAIVYCTSAGIFFLQFHGLFVEGQRAHQSFPTVPGEHYLRHGLRIYVFFNKLFQQLLTHYVLGVVLV